MFFETIAVSMYTLQALYLFPKYYLCETEHSFRKQNEELVPGSFGPGKMNMVFCQTRVRAGRPVPVPFRSEGQNDNCSRNEDNVFLKLNVVNLSQSDLPSRPAGAQPRRLPVSGNAAGAVTVVAVPSSSGFWPWGWPPRACGVRQQTM